MTTAQTTNKQTGIVPSTASRPAARSSTTPRACLAVSTRVRKFDGRVTVALAR